MVEKQLGKLIKILQCIRGSEFAKTEFLNHLALYGIIRHISCPTTPKQNGVA